MRFCFLARDRDKDRDRDRDRERDRGRRESSRDRGVDRQYLKTFLLVGFFFEILFNFEFRSQGNNFEGSTPSTVEGIVVSHLAVRGSILSIFHNCCYVRQE